MAAIAILAGMNAATIACNIKNSMYHILMTGACTLVYARLTNASGLPRLLIPPASATDKKALKKTRLDIVTDKNAPVRTSSSF